MHVDGIGDIAQDEGTQMLYAVLEEAVLAADDFRCHPEDGVGALIQGLDQPVGGLEPLGDEFLVRLAARLAPDFGEVPVVDQHPGQGLGPEFDVPAAGGVGPDHDLGRDRLGDVVIEGQARLGVEGLDFLDHLGEVLGVHPADLPERREVAFGKQVEVVEKALHRRVEPVALAQLQGEAFAQRSREYSRRVELLEPPEGRFDAPEPAIEKLGDVADLAGEISGLVDHVDEVQSDHPVDGIVDIDLELGHQMIPEACLLGQELLDVVFGVVETAAAFAPGGKGFRLVARGLGLVLAGPGVLEVGLQRRLVEIHHFFFRPGKFLGARGLGVAAGPVPAPTGFVLAVGAGFGVAVFLAAVVDLEKGILLQLLLDVSRQLLVGHLQQLDRLLQLGRHDQGGGLALA